MKLPKIIIFDVGGTLIEGEGWDNYQIGYKYLYEEVFDVKESFEEFMHFVGLVRPMIKKREKTQFEFSFQSFFNYLKVAYGLKTTKSYYEIEIEFIAKFYTSKPVLHVKELLDFLTSKGVLLYVLSNSMYSTNQIIDELKRNNLDEYFLEIVSTGDHLLRKPSLELFKMYLKKCHIMGYKTSEVCYIGNMYHYDIASPVRLGMKAVHKGKEFKKHTGYVEINDYLELIKMWSK